MFKGVALFYFVLKTIFDSLPVRFSRNWAYWGPLGIVRNFVSFFGGGYSNCFSDLGLYYVSSYFLNIVI